MTTLRRLTCTFPRIYRLHHLVLLLHLYHLSKLASSVSASSDFLPPPITGLSKAELCALDVDSSRYALELVKLKPEQSPMLKLYESKIFCFVNTISVHHKTRAQSVADTWGQRCDKLMFFSNVSDTIIVGAHTPRERRYDVIKMDVIADHNHLWQKHKATLRYVYTHFRHDYDWFYKADDDAYVIVDNLRQYLRRPEIMQSYKQVPMQMGHRFNLTQDLVSYYIVNNSLETTWRSKWDRWIFNSGGPGYAMNRLYLDKIVSILSDWTCLSDRYSTMLPDDASITFCMMWHDVVPWDTRDHQGRERWHSDKPRGVYFTNPNRLNYCPPLMYHLERTLYWCREEDDVGDLAVFNDKYGLAISDNILVFQEVAQPKLLKKVVT